VDLESEEVSQTMREEDGADSFLHQFFNGFILDYSHLDQVLQDDPLGKQMHVLPLNPRLHCSFHCGLGLKDGLIDFPLFWCEFPRDGEGHRLVSDIAVPLPAQIQQDHLALFYLLVVLDVVEGGAVAAGGADGAEAQLQGPGADGVLELKDGVELVLGEAHLCGAG